MKGQSSYAPPCGGVNFPGVNQEVAWAKASFHVDSGSTTAAIKVNGVTVAEKAISAGQNVVLEGKITPVQATDLLVGLYPVTAIISNIKVEWADAAQAPADVGVGGIWEWIKANPLLVGAIVAGVYLVARK